MAASAPLSRAVIEKLLRDVIPEDVAMQKETIDWVSDCAAAFVQRVGSTANEIAESSAKKENYRITPDHILQALESLDMPVCASAARAQQHALAEQMQTKKRQRGASRKAGPSDASQAELLAAQNALFQAASLRAAREGW